MQNIHNIQTYNHITLVPHSCFSSFKHSTLQLISATFTEEIETPFAFITHKTYAHMKYSRLLVTQIRAVHKRGTDFGARLLLKYADFREGTEDLDVIYHGRDESNIANW